MMPSQQQQQQQQQAMQAPGVANLFNLSVGPLIGLNSGGYNVSAPPVLGPLSMGGGSNASDAVLSGADNSSSSISIGSNNNNSSSSLVPHPIIPIAPIGQQRGQQSPSVNERSLRISSSNPPSPPLVPTNSSPTAAMSPLHASSKPFYPAYSSPLLKNVTTFAETRLTKSFGSFAATFAGFSCAPFQVGTCISSPIVEIEGHQWSVRVYANGVDDSAAGFISCYVVHESDESVRAAVKITLINAKFSSDNHIVSTDSDKVLPGKGSTLGWSKFIHQSSFSRYCVEDVLVLRIELTLFTAPKQVVLAAPRRPPPPRSSTNSDPTAKLVSAADSLAALLFDATTADVLLAFGPDPGEKAGEDTIIPGEEAETEEEDTIPAHKFVLAMRSETFKHLFGLGGLPPAHGNNNTSLPRLRRGGAGRKDVVWLPAGGGRGVDGSIARELVRYLYTGGWSAEVLRGACDVILTLACRLELSGLAALCASQLAGTLCAENVSRVLRAADACQAADLRAAALAYIVRHAAAVVHHADFFEHLSPALRMDVILALATHQQANHAK